MDASFADTHLAGVAAAIAEPARARILCCLMDGHARTSTELSVVAQVSASTASAHLLRLREVKLVVVLAQGKHRYYRLADADVAAAIEALLRLAGAPQARFVPTTPDRLRLARTCYDHLAGTIAVGIHDAMHERGWLVPAEAGDGAYELSEAGATALEQAGVEVGAARIARRRFACSCLDWSERQPHLAGALGAQLLAMMLRRQWLERQLDGRALGVTVAGRRQLAALFGVAP